MLARLVWDLCLLLYLPHLGWADPDMRRWRATVWLSLLEFGLLLAVSGWLWMSWRQPVMSLWNEAIRLMTGILILSTKYGCGS